MDCYDVKAWKCSICGQENFNREVNETTKLLRRSFLFDTRLRCFACDVLLFEGSKKNYIFVDLINGERVTHYRNFPAWVDNPVKLFGLVWSDKEEAYIKKQEAVKVGV